MLSFSQIVSLIESLYLKTLPPAQVAQIQQSLQALQKHQDGLNLAEKLLDPALELSTVCQFFGALTYTVQLNMMFSVSVASGDRYERDSEKIRMVLTKQLFFLNALLDQNLQGAQNMFVIRKLFSNLSLIYMHFHEFWPNPLLTTLLGDSAASAVGMDLPRLLNGVSLQKVNYILTFSQTLAEDVLKKGSSADKLDQLLHMLLKNEVFPVSEVFILRAISECLAQFEAAIKCLSAWIAYASFSELNSPERIDPSTILESVILCVSQASYEADHLSVSLEFLSQLVLVYANLLKPSLKAALSELILGKWGMGYLNHLSMDPEEKETLIVDFSRLLIAYFELDMPKMSLLLIDEQSQYVFQALLKLLDFPGLPVIEEDVSREYIEFWLELSDFMVDDTDSMLIYLKTPENMEMFKNNFKQLLQNLGTIYGQKIQLPMHDPGLMLQTASEEYQLYRKDVADLFETIFPEIKDHLLQSLVHTISQAADPAQTEASVFILSAILPGMSENNVSPEDIALLEKIFLSPIIQQNDCYPLISSTVALLSELDFFFALPQGAPYLDTALSFLFSVLQVSGRFPSRLEHVTARAVAHICDTSRTKLHNSLGRFDSMLESVLSDPNLKAFTREKMALATACVVQGLPNPEIQASHVSRALGLIEKAFAIAAENISLDQGLDHMILLMACVAEYARGMQLPDDEESPQREQLLAFWAGSEAQDIQQHVLRLVLLFLLDSGLNRELVSRYNDGAGFGALPGAVRVNYHSQATETCCSIFRAGLAEKNGPFCFPGPVVMDYVLAKIESLSSLGGAPAEILMLAQHLYGLVETVFISEYRSFTTESTGLAIQKLVLDQALLLGSDVDLYAQAMKFMAAILEKKPGLLLFANVNLEAVFEASLLALKASREKFVARAAVRFWAACVSMKLGTREDQLKMEEIMKQSLGERVTRATFEAILAAPRSGYDAYSRLVKIFVGKYPLDFKRWAEKALAEMSVERQAAGGRSLDVEGVVKGLVVSRGGRGVEGILKKFWLGGNGLVDM